MINISIFKILIQLYKYILYFKLIFIKYLYKFKIIYKYFYILFINLYKFIKFYIIKHIISYKIKLQYIKFLNNFNILKNNFKYFILKIIKSTKVTFKGKTRKFKIIILLIYKYQFFSIGIGKNITILTAYKNAKYNSYKNLIFYKIYLTLSLTKPYILKFKYNKLLLKSNYNKQYNYKINFIQYILNLLGLNYLKCINLIPINKLHIYSIIKYIFNYIYFNIYLKNLNYNLNFLNILRYINT